MGRPHTFRIALLATSVLFVTWLAAAGAFAQESGPAPERAEPKPPPIQAIALEDISERAASATAELAALTPDEASREALTQLASELKTTRKTVAARLDEVRAALQTEPKLRTLDELEKQLLALAQPLQARDQALDRQITALGASLEEVDRKAEVWKETAAAAREARSSQSTLSRVAATRSEIDRVRKDLVRRRNEVLTLRDQLVAPRASLEDILKEVREAKQTRLQGVFSSSRSPLWSASVREALVQELREGLGESLSSRLTEVWDYARQQARLLGLQVALVLALALWLRALRSRVRAEVAQHEDLREAAQVFELPTAMALVITLAISPQIHPLAPNLFMRVLGTVAVIPAVLIVQRLLPRAMLPLLMGLLIFFIVDRVRELLATLPTLERVLLQLEMVGAVGFLAWMIRPSHLERIPAELLRGRALRVTGAGMRAAMVVLAIAIAVDVIGFGDLADLLGTATLRSAFVALFVFAVLAALQSLAAYALLVRPLRLLNGITRHRRRVRDRIDRVLRIGAALVWAYVVLSFFGLEQIAVSAALRILDAGVSVGALSISLGDVAVLGLTVWLTFGLARLVDFVLGEDVFPRLRLSRGVPYAISSIARYSLIVLGFLVALAAAGIELTKLTVVAGGLGVGIGFGLQNVVNNFVSGLILLFERPLQVGDTVQLPDLWGEITRIGIRASVIRTFEGAEVIVPNGLLISDPVTNWTLSDQRRRVEVKVGVEYGTDAKRVIDLLLGVARAHPRILERPEPEAFFLNFGDSALEFVLRAWLPEFAGGYQVRSDLAVAIQRALKEAGIGVPFPQRDLHVRTIDPAAASELARGREPGSGAPR